MSKENECPWCGAEQSDLWEYGGLRSDGDQIETECGSCGKEIEITMCVSVDYDIKAIGCDLHEFEIGDCWYPGADFLHLKCTKCKAAFYDWSLEGGIHEELKKPQYTFVGRAAEEAKARGIT